MGDEGIGVHMAQELAAAQPAWEIDVVDGGTGGFHLLEYFESYETVILADATLDANPPGTIRLIQPQFASDFPQAMSTHDIGLKDLVSALQLLGKMPVIYLYVVSISSLQQQGLGLTPQIQQILPVLRDTIRQLVAGLLYPFAVSKPITSSHLLDL